MAEEEDGSWVKETVQNKESSWTREREKSKPSSSVRSSKSTVDTALREKNKRIRIIYEDEGLEYGKDATTAGEIVDRFKVATSLRTTRIKQVLKLIKQSRHVQLCFMIAATGSMGPHIDGVKKSIHQIVRQLECNKPNNGANVEQLFLGMVAYRDYGDSPQFDELPFTKSTEVFKRFCDGVKPFGGDDACEDVLGGLDRALKLKWDPNCGTKVIFHMADYPGHGRELHDVHESSYDNYLDKEPKNLKYQDLFKQVREKNIDYYFGKIHDRTNTMIQKFSRAYGDPIVDFKVADVEKICESVIQAVILSVSSSISKSTLTTAVKREIRPHVLVEAEPDWSKMNSHDGSLLSYSFPESIQNVVDDVPLGRRPPKSTKVKIAEQPFAKGNERLAFYGLDLSVYVEGSGKDSKGKKKESIELKTKNEKIVLKEYLHVGHGMNTAKRYELTNQMQTIASYLALEFTKKLKAKTGIDKTIKFLKIRTLSVGREGGVRYMSCERRYKEGDVFLRFTNNTNYSILESKAKEKGVSMEYIEILTAFSHWTFQMTVEKLMVVDLQGIVTTDDKGKKQIILTDPAIHCKDPTRFGPMNHGVDGMKNFFERHACNRFCKNLDLVKPEFDCLGLPSIPVHKK